MEKKNKTLLYVVGVLLVIGVGISLAYFAAAILTRGNGAVTNVKTANIGDTTIVTEGNIEFTDTDIYPGHKNISKIKITATGQGDVTYHLIWKGENTLQTSLNYTLYKSTTDETPSVACTKKSQGNLTKILFEECTNSGFDNLEQLATGSIATTTSETTFRLKEDESITATTSGTVVYYYVVLEFPNVESSQNFDADGRFEGETNIEVPDANDPNVPIGVDELIARLDLKEGTPDFSQVAIGTETEENNGIFETDDPMYGENAKTYYWRGAATTNHVIFDSKCWRIVRINGDKSIRLIYNGTTSGNTCTQGVNSNSVIMGSSDSEKYYATSDGQYDNPSYVGWTYTLNSQRTTSGTASNAKTQTEKWYNSNISTAAKAKVDSNGKFCGDRNIGQPYTGWGWSTNDYVTSWSAWSSNKSKYFTYAGAKRLYESYAPTLSCSIGDVYTLSVGAITSDEVEFAGGKNENNTSYYLYNGQSYWTMSPYRWVSSSAYVFVVNPNGYLTDWNVHLTPGLRPVINLLPDTQFVTGGNGTADNPYVVQI